MKRGFKLSLITAGLLAGSVAMAAGTPELAPTQWYPMYASLGFSYPFVKGNSTKGNLETSDEASNVNAYIKGSNIDYSSFLSPSLALGWRIDRFFSVGLFYSQIQTDLQPDPTVTNSTGIERLSFRSDMKIDRLMVQGFANWYHAFTIGKVPFTPFLGIGLGGAHISVKNAQLTYDSGENSNNVETNGRWNFAYSGEVGLTASASSHVDISLGFRYVYLGKYKSGTTLVESTNTMKQAVSAKLYAYEPNVSVAYKFG
jgi:opacity protein-like surface antigen